MSKVDLTDFGDRNGEPRHAGSHFPGLIAHGIAWGRWPSLCLFLGRAKN